MTQIALITGGNRGLGLETARRLARSGAVTIIGSREIDAGLDAASALSDEGFTAEAVRLDVTSPESVEAAARVVEERHGRLDVLVNNAGILPEATSQGAGPLGSEQFIETYDTNVFGVVRVVDAFLPLLQRSKAGRIVNISSTMGSLTDHSDPDSPYHGVAVPAYRSSKAAVNSVTVALSQALADTAIKVNSVCPGFVQTDLTPQSRDQAPITAEEASKVVAAMTGPETDLPSGRFVDSAGPVAW